MLIHLPGKKSKTIEVDSVGSVLLEKSKRARHLRISIRPFKGIRVAVPYGISFTRAEEFINSHVKWMIRHLRQMKQVEQEYQQNQKQTLQLSDRQEARRILINRLHELASQHGFAFNRVFIRNQATLWGSCSARNNINLNLKLVCLPQHYMDYVILHELVHTKIKNHSRIFWTELAKYIADPRSLSKELRRSGLIERV
jgi:predicted metal-dependent hydrolase